VGRGDTAGLRRGNRVGVKKKKSVRGDCVNFHTKWDGDGERWK